MFNALSGVVATLFVAATLLYCTPNGTQEVEPTVENEPVEIVEVIEEETEVIEPVIEEEPEVEESIVEEPELTYFVEVVDGYITEESLQSICAYVGNMYDVSPILLQAIAWVESGYRVEATSYCDARGLCQIMEIWNWDRMERLGVTDLYDPYNSVLLCADLLVELEQCTYGDDIRFVLMAYNAGQYGAADLYEEGIILEYVTKVLDKVQELEDEML